MTNTSASSSAVPQTVTPPSNYKSASSSWEDFGEGFYGTANKNRRNLDRSMNSATTASTSFEDDDMPMDEMMSISKSVSHERDYTPSLEVQSANTNRMILALKSHSGVRPDGLSVDEQRLWDAFQDVLVKVSKSETKDVPEPPAGHRSPTYPSAAATIRINQLEEQLREAQSELKKKEGEHDTEVRAIQRVLAEMSTEREEETKVLNETVSTLSKKVELLEKQRMEAWKSNPGFTPPPPPPPSAQRSTPNESSPSRPGAKPATMEAYKQEISKLKSTLNDVEAQKLSFKKEIDRKSRRLIILERDFKIAKTQLKRVEDDSPEAKDLISLSGEVENLRLQLEDAHDRNKRLQAELDGVGKKSKRKPMGSMTPPRPESTSTADTESVSSAISAEEVESLQKSLTDTTSSLENAKKIIASLENANGSMAVDLRAKLKSKEEELHMVQLESAERKRRLDSLATELRDLQKKQDDVNRLERQSKAQLVRHKALMGLLERSVSGLQSASVVHEVSTNTGEPDQSNVDRIAEILGDTMIGIQSSLELSEQFMEEFDDASTVAFTDADLASDVGRQIDAIIRHDREAAAQNLKEELEQKRAVIVRLETTLQKQNEELNRLKTAGTNDELLSEIQSLRDQCSTNMEVLAKKERELSVLRSSLKVDENDAGYISDDASDGEDENDAAVSPTRLNGYGPAETEALATLMAAGGNVLSRDGQEGNPGTLRLAAEKDKALKDLQTERENLANAKLIISSLEKANRTMMEDLRSRLQDSNSAIASLLDKSMQHEKSSIELKDEVEKLRKEKEELEQKHQKELQKMKDETQASSLRIESKEMELHDLKKSEEKKDDVDDN